jgi:hypothetical protein
VGTEGSFVRRHSLIHTLTCIKVCSHAKRQFLRGNRETYSLLSLSFLSTLISPLKLQHAPAEQCLVSMCKTFFCFLQILRVLT